jgi:tetratricopeptide (TPR) repeat protein/CHAT domain-containing protein
MMKSLPSAESNSALLTTARRHSIIVDLHDNTIMYRYAYTDDASIASLLGDLPLEEFPGQQVDLEKASRRVSQLNRAVAACDASSLTRLSKILSRQIIQNDLTTRLEEATSGDLVLLLDPDLSWIPWELLWNKGTFLCRRFSVARNLHKSRKEVDRAKEQLLKTASGKALILFGDVSGIAAGKEYDIIAELLKPIYGTQVTFRTTETSDDALECLGESYYDLCHFIGHGIWDQDNPDESGWQFSDKSVLTCKQIQGDATGIKFPRLIVANSCHSARSIQPTRSGEQSSHDPSAGGANAAVSTLYRSFLSQGVPHYIGTIAQVPDKVSQVFTQTFYEALAGGRSIGESLFRAREVASASQGWAFYVHYGNPALQLVARAVGARLEEPVAPAIAVPQLKRPRWQLAGPYVKRGAVSFLVVIAALLVFSWYRNQREIFHGTFGVALASFEVKDLSGTSVRDYPEHLVSHEDIDGFFGQFVGQTPHEFKDVSASFRTHEEAWAWGKKHRASGVIWGSAERSSKGLAVHLKATRIALPERDFWKEAYKRSFVHMVFPEYFRDAKTYATDLDLGTLSVDLTSPEQMSAVRREASLLTDFIGGVLAYAEGEYQRSIRVFEQIVSSQGSPELHRLAKRWLVLCYLNDKEYEAARWTFSDLVDPKSLSDEDSVRLAFLKAAYNWNAEGVYPRFDKEEERVLWKAAGSESLSPWLKVIAAILATRGRYIPLTGAFTNVSLDRPQSSRDDEPQRVARLERSLDLALSESPNDYFFHYLVATVTTRGDLSDQEFGKAEKLNPRAEELHFGRAVVLSRRGDVAAALREIDKAIAANPSQATYSYEKWSLLDDLKYRELGSTHDAARKQQIALGENMLRNPDDPKIHHGIFFEELAKAYTRARQPKEALRVLEQAAASLSNDPVFCRRAATISMRQIGDLAAARRFLESVYRGRGSQTDQELEFLSIESRWREGDYQAAMHEFVQGVFYNRWKKDPRESPALDDVIGNIQHTAGHYDEAETALREAKQRASQISRDPNDSVSRYGRFDYTLRETDRKWNWATSYDLGLVLLSAGKYADAARELEHTMNFLETTVVCPGCRCIDCERNLIHGTYAEKEPYAFSTRMCLGYAYFKDKKYDSAAQAWLAAGRPLKYKVYGYSPAGIEKVIEEDLPEVRRRFQEFPDYPNLIELVDRLVILKKYKEARTLVEQYILSQGEETGTQDDSIAKLLFLYLMTDDLQGAETTFLDYVRLQTGGLTSKASFAGLNTSLNPGILPIEIQRLGKPDYFLDVIANNPFRRR